jgi:cytochrome c oxidase subunit 1
VAHWHFVTWQAVVFGIFAAWYYFFPKVTGYSYSELLGKVHFWLSFIGVSASYVSLVLVLAYMPRRMIDIPDAFGYANLASLIGAYIAAAGTLVFFVNMVLAFLRRRPAP